MICFVAAGAFYYVVQLVLPSKVIPDGHEIENIGYEEMAQTDGYLMGDAIVEFSVLEGRQDGGSGSTEGSILTSKELPATASEV